MFKDNRGASMAEYAVIAAIVIAVAVIAFGTLGGKIVAAINKLTGGSESSW